MHRILTLLIAALVVCFFADVSSAQIGRGRLLKKMRDDLFGAPDQAQQAAQQKLEAARRAQLEQQKRAAAAKKPTPIGTGSQTPTRPQASPNRSQVQRTPQTQQRRPTAVQPPRNARTAATAPKKGFGFQLVEKERKLYISQLDPAGNAAAKGLRRGDIITGVGGVEVDSTDAFDEIIDILSSGDSIEIAYVRGGKTNEAQVPFGEAPNSDQAANEFEGRAEPVATRTSTQRTADFAPPRQQGSSRNYNPAASNNEVERLSTMVRQQSQQIQALQNELRAYRQQAPAIQANSSRRSSSVLNPSSN